MIQYRIKVFRRKKGKYLAITTAIILLIKSVLLTIFLYSILYILKHLKIFL